jgi:hypothetical protein
MIGHTVVNRAARMVRGQVRQWLGSVHYRVLAWCLVILVGATGVGAVVIRAVLLDRLDSQIEAQLTREVAEVQRLAAGGINPETGQPFGGNVAAIFDAFLARNVPDEGGATYTVVNGRPYKRSIFGHDLLADAQFAARLSVLTGSERGEVDTPLGSARYIAVPIRGADQAGQGVFMAANFPAGERAEIDQTVRVMAVVSVITLLAGGAVALLTVGWALAPLRAPARSVVEVGERDLRRRVEVEGSDDVAELGHDGRGEFDTRPGAGVTNAVVVPGAGADPASPDGPVDGADPTAVTPVPGA